MNLWELTVIISRLKLGLFRKEVSWSFWGHKITILKDSSTDTQGWFLYTAQRFYPLKRHLQTSVWVNFIFDIKAAGDQNSTEVTETQMLNANVRNVWRRRTPETLTNEPRLKLWCRNQNSLSFHLQNGDFHRARCAECVQSVCRECEECVRVHHGTNKPGIYDHMIENARSNMEPAALCTAAESLTLSAVKHNHTVVIWHSLHVLVFKSVWYKS